jgi:D-alanyl-D-alanine carboxypeptidase
VTFSARPPRFVTTFAVIAALSLCVITRADAEALLLVDAESGKVLHSENSTQPWYPASVTKLMTAYVTLRAVKERRLTLDTLLTVSPNAVAQAPSKMGFKAGTTVTVDNALKMLMVKSANDVAVVLAEGVSGSIESFADDMNRTAQRLGMVQTSYVNPNGLPADGQITSARDLAILARALIREFPEYELYWHISAIKFGKRVMRNYNTLIDRYPGADGMKTGFICASGFNLVGTATRNGKRLIAVVLGAPSGPVRAVKAAQMLERGFSNNGFSWLAPSLGTVDQLVPIKADPPDLREQSCGKHRKRPGAESEDGDDDVSAAQVDAAAPNSINMANLRGNISKPSTLLQPLTPSMEPIVVFTGATRPGNGTAIATAPAAKPKKAPAVAATGGAAVAAPKPQEKPQEKPSVSAPAFAATPPNYPTPNAFTPSKPAAPAAAAGDAATPKPKPAPKVAATKPADKPADAKAKTTTAKPDAKTAAKPDAKTAAKPGAKPVAQAAAKPAPKPTAAQ